MNEQAERIGRRTALAILMGALLVGAGEKASAQPLDETSLDYYGGRRCYWRRGRRVCVTIFRPRSAG